ncbi:MAG: hypothetical protein H6753_03580 [Candidatus Omnitrophica bacterium]|nr:hypothetical protein [Candidatus Omnitrophota bacterium]
MNNTKAPLLLAIYGDSLSLPRSFDGVYCDQVYCELLRKEGAEFKDFSNMVVFNRSHGGICIKGLFEQFSQDLSYISKDKNKILIIQCGIVDCAPRPIPSVLRMLVGKMPVRVRVKIAQFLHKNRSRIQNIIYFRLTNPKNFRRILKKWLLVAGTMFKRIYVVNIFPTTQNIAEHSPGFCESIQIYNQIIFEEVHKAEMKNIVLLDVFKKISILEKPIEHFVSEKDGHHLTPNGHELIKRLILEKYEE